MHTLGLRYKAPVTCVQPVAQLLKMLPVMAWACEAQEVALVFVIDVRSLWLEPSWGFGHHGAQIQPVQEGQGDGG